MERWSLKIEEQISTLLKDWLKQKGKTQKDLRNILNASSERMPALMEVLKAEYQAGGIPKIAAVLCSIEEEWAKNNQRIQNNDLHADPFSQLDLLLEEIKEDCNS